VRGETQLANPYETIQRGTSVLEGEGHPLGEKRPLDTLQEYGKKDLLPLVKKGRAKGIKENCSEEEKS